jgi:hypothetical protein
VSNNGIRNKVEQLLREGFFSRERVAELRVGEPLAVIDPAGHQHSWFVPLQVGSKLAGFAQLLPSLEPIAFSSFPHNSPDYADCPDVEDWTDRTRIMKMASTIARPDERLAEPVLTFDRTPSRLAWSVQAISPSGAMRTLFVAGNAVYEGTNAGGLF